MPSALMNQALQAGQEPTSFQLDVQSQLRQFPLASGREFTVDNDYHRILNRTEQTCIGTLGLLTLVLPAVEWHKLFSLLRDIELII